MIIRKGRFPAAKLFFLVLLRRVYFSSLNFCIFLLFFLFISVKHETASVKQNWIFDCFPVNDLKIFFLIFSLFLTIKRKEITFGVTYLGLLECGRYPLKSVSLLICIMNDLMIMQEKTSGELENKINCQQLSHSMGEFYYK